MLALVLLLGGCSALASREATVVCQAADVVSTYHAVRHGAIERNPLWKGVISHLGWGGFLLGKVAVTLVLLEYHEELGQSGALINAASCAAALNNGLVGAVAK